MPEVYTITEIYNRYWYTKQQDIEVTDGRNLLDFFSYHVPFIDQVSRINNVVVMINMPYFVAFVILFYDVHRMFIMLSLTKLVACSNIARVVSCQYPIYYIH
jgi:hypothetical protein